MEIDSSHLMGRLVMAVVFEVSNVNSRDDGVYLGDEEKVNLVFLFFHLHKLLIECQLLHLDFFHYVCIFHLH